MWKSVEKSTARDKDQTFADFYQSQQGKAKNSVNLPRAPFHEDDSYGYKQSPNKINRTRDKLMSADRLAFYQP